MRKKITYNLFFITLILLTACTEAYSPEVNTDKDALVVQGLITNEKTPFYVRLSKAKLYNSSKSTTYVTNAKVIVYSSDNQSYTLTNNGNGYYYLPSNFTSEIGITYTLHIETDDGNNYESDPQKLLPPLTTDTIYGAKSTNKFLGLDNQIRSVAGSSVLTDLFGTSAVSNADSFPKCRFKSQITLQYEYWVDRDQDAYYMVYKYWKTFTPDELENITENNSNADKPYIQAHNICFVPVELSAYGLSKPTDFKEAIYYLRINQYTLNKSTYDFYTEANKQASADGKIFDPVTSQLLGNIHCINDHSKIVLGFFEVSSVSNTAYRLSHYLQNPTVTLTKAPYVGVTEGEVHYKKMKKDFPPENDESYTDITPSWWYHY